MKDTKAKEGGPDCTSLALSPYSPHSAQHQPQKDAQPMLLDMQRFRLHFKISRRMNNCEMYIYLNGKDGRRSNNLPREGNIPIFFPLYKYQSLTMGCFIGKVIKLEEAIASGILCCTLFYQKKVFFLDSAGCCTSCLLWWEITF